MPSIIDQGINSATDAANTLSKAIVSEVKSLTVKKSAFIVASILLIIYLNKLHEKLKRKSEVYAFVEDTMSRVQYWNTPHRTGDPPKSEEDYQYSKTHYRPQ